MKKILFFVSLLLLTCLHAQSLKKNFTSRFKDSDEKLLADKSLISYTNSRVSAGQVISLLILENINLNKVKGSGKQSTVLTATFTSDGTLAAVKAEGENNDLNEAALAVLESYIGDQTSTGSLSERKTQIKIPLSVTL